MPLKGTTILNPVQAKYMEDEHCWIDTDPANERAFRSSCGPESIRRLKPDKPLDPPLVDTIVALAMPAGSELPSAYLCTKIYEETRRSGFGDSKRLVNQMPRDRPWIFGILESNRWSAVEIGWQDGRIGYYDPQCYRARTTRWKEVIDVSKTPLVSRYLILIRCLSISQAGLSISAMTTPAESGTRERALAPCKIEMTPFIAAYLQP